MKGLRNDPVASRKSTLYQDPKTPAVLGACFLLFILTILDGAVRNIDSTEKFARLRSLSFRSPQPSVS